jgi:hypothetical protein
VIFIAKDVAKSENTDSGFGELIGLFVVGFIGVDSGILKATGLPVLKING